MGSWKNDNDPNNLKPPVPSQAAQTASPSTFLKGGDFSHYQTKIDTKLYPATGHQFVITKASDGLGSLDSFFHTAREDAHTMGMPFLGYHFLRFSGLSAKEQVKLFLSAFGTINKGEGIITDYEWSNSGGDAARYGDGKQADSASNDILYAFKTDVEQITGLPLIIYTGRSFMPMVDHRFEKNPLWVFDYHTTARQTPHIGQKPILPPTWGSWAFWQFSDREQIAGSGAVDASVFNGDISALRALVKQ